MKNKNSVAFLLLLLVLSTSCSKWLDVSSKTNIKQADLLQTESGFRDVLTGVYYLMTSQNLYGKELTYGYNDVRAQYWTLEHPDHKYSKTITYSYTEAKELPFINTFWKELYTGIANLNSIIDQFETRKNIFTEGNYYLYKGEALALRAMLHFEVLRLYGPSPASENAMSALSIPYYESVTNSPQSPLTMKVVLDKALKDLSDARTLMQDYDAYGPKYKEIEAKLTSSGVTALKRHYKMNYWAVTALKARVELYAGYKTEAFETAKELILEPESDFISPPFNMTKNDTEGAPLFTSELIFRLEKLKLKDEMESTFNESVLTTTTGLYLKLVHYNRLFPSGGSDVEYRRSWFKTLTNSPKSYILTKYVETTNIPLFRVSELFYIAAECAPTEEVGRAYLNKIRRHRGLTELLPAASLGNEIRAEYLREFIGEGQMFYYYKRKGETTIGLRLINVTSDNYVLPMTDLEKEFGKVTILNAN